VKVQWKQGGHFQYTLNINIHGQYREFSWVPCGGFWSMHKGTPDVVTHPDLALASVFARKMQSPPFLQGDVEILSEKFAPPRLLHRQSEQDKIAGLLASLVTHSLPTHLFVYGKSGSGKTVTVTHVLEYAQHLKDVKRPVKYVLVNCRKQVSHHALLCQLLEQLEPSSYYPSNTSWRDLNNHLLTVCRKAGVNIVMVLDEVDRLEKKGEGFDALYTLANLNAELGGTSSTVTVFAISNNLHFGEQLEHSVKSRLRVEKLYFAPYSQQQLVDILNDRAKVVFAEGGLELDIIPYCAVRAAQEHGDARQALGLLYKAAVIACDEGALKVTMHHVMKARVALEHDVIVEGIQRLTVHEKFILLAIARLCEHPKVTHDVVTTGMVLEAYRKICHEVGAEPLTLQSVNRLLDDLENQVFITTDIRSLGRGRGRTRFINIAVPLELTINILQEDSAFHEG